METEVMVMPMPICCRTAKWLGHLMGERCTVPAQSQMYSHISACKPAYQPLGYVQTSSRGPLPTICWSCAVAYAGHWTSKRSNAFCTEVTNTHNMPLRQGIKQGSSPPGESLNNKTSGSPSGLMASATASAAGLERVPNNAARISCGLLVEPPQAEGLQHWFPTFWACVQNTGLLHTIFPTTTVTASGSGHGCWTPCCLLVAGMLWGLSSLGYFLDRGAKFARPKHC